MSSFRIDKQYVSFEPVEAHHVYRDEPVGHGWRQEESDIPAEAYICQEDVEAYCTEMICAAQGEAEKRAQDVIAHAREEAEAIMGSAKLQAAKAVKEADDHAEDIRESARAAGYAQGMENAAAEADARRKKEAENLRTLTAKLENDYSDLLDGMKKDLIPLITEITKKIINVKLKESDQVFIGLINEAVDHLKETNCLIIRVSPEDYARYFGSDAANGIDTGGTKAVVIEEDGFSSGDLIVESEGEMLDLGINGQIKRLEAAFSEKGS